MECHFLSGGAVSYQDKFSIVDNREFRTTTKSKSRVALEKQSINQSINSRGFGGLIQHGSRLKSELE